MNVLLRNGYPTVPGTRVVRTARGTRTRTLCYCCYVLVRVLLTVTGYPGTNFCINAPTPTLDLYRCPCTVPSSRR